jgi:hypothetical protein
VPAIRVSGLQETICAHVNKRPKNRIAVAVGAATENVVTNLQIEDLKLY